MKTLDKLAIAFNILAAVVFIIELCMGETLTYTWLTLMWCVDALMCYWGWTRTTKDYREISEDYTQTLHEYFELEEEKERLETELLELKGKSIGHDGDDEDEK